MKNGIESSIDELEKGKKQLEFISPQTREECEEKIKREYGEGIIGIDIEKTQELKDFTIFYYSEFGLFLEEVKEKEETQISYKPRSKDEKEQEKILRDLSKLLDLKPYH